MLTYKFIVKYFKNRNTAKMSYSIYTNDQDITDCNEREYQSLKSQYGICDENTLFVNCANKADIMYLSNYF